MTIDEKVGNTLGLLGLIALPFIIGGVIYLSKKAEVGGEIMRGRDIRQARQGQDRGRGVRREDIERALRHYNIDEAEYLRCPSCYPLPPRGTGL